MRTPIIAGNWKMNLTIDEGLKLVNGILDKLNNSVANSKIEIIVAPDYTSINKTVEVLKNSPIKVSSQNIFWEENGAFTGEVSPSMLKEAGASHVIIGHSERRRYFSETNETVNKKIKASLKHELTPIVCIGETLKEREADKVEEVIRTQLIDGLAELNQEEITKIILAYEPIWAIGTGKTATPEQAEKVHLMIRDFLSKKFGRPQADTVRILYGGSVKPSNAQELLSKPNIDGALVGGASLQAKDFVSIIEAI